MMVNEIEQIKHGKMFPGCEGEWKRRVVVSNRVAGWGNHWEDNFGAKAWRRWGIELDWILGEEASRQRKQSMQKTWGRTMPDTFIEKQIGIEWKRGKRRQVREALGQAMYPVSYNTESYKFVREVLFFFFLFRLHPWRMEIPRPGTDSKPQMWTTPPLTHCARPRTEPEPPEQPKHCSWILNSLHHQANLGRYYFYFSFSVKGTKVHRVKVTC